MNKDEQDRDCVQRCLRGETEAFAELLDRYERPVYNAIVRLGADREDARDICQHVFIKVYQRLNAFDQSRKFFSWLYRVAVNEAINRMKSKKSWEPLSDDMEYERASPEEELKTVEQQREIKRALLMLDMKYRIAIVVYHFLQLSYEEAAQILSIPEKTLKSRLFTARQLLRDILEERYAVR